MSTPRTSELLRLSHQRDLTPIEESELATLLEQPENRNLLDADIASAKARIAVALDYQAALAPTGSPATPPVPVATLDAARRSALAKPRQAKRTGQIFKWATLALAASIALVVWLSSGHAPLNKRPHRLEIGVVAMAGTWRNTDAAPTPVPLGEGWTRRELTNRGQLQTWSQTLPDDVTARFWVDEDTGSLRVILRRDGKTLSEATPLRTEPSVPEQIRQFAEKLGLAE